MVVVHHLLFVICHLQETRAWKRLQAAHQNSFVRILPARAMEVVQEVVGTLRVCKFNYRCPPPVIPNGWDVCVRAQIIATSAQREISRFAR